MIVVILSSCLLALTLSSPVRIARDLNSGSDEAMSTQMQLVNALMLQRMMQSRRLNAFPNSNRFRDWNYMAYLNRLGQSPWLNNYGPSVANGMNVLAQTGVGMTSLSADMSLEDMGGTIQQMLATLGLPDYGLPLDPTYDDPFGPGLDTNPFGFDQKNPGGAAAKGVDAQPPAAAVLPFLDPLQGTDVVGLNLGDDRTDAGSNQTAGHLATGVDFNPGDLLPNAGLLSQPWPVEDLLQAPQSAQAQGVDGAVSSVGAAMEGQSMDDGVDTNSMAESLEGVDTIANLAESLEGSISASDEADLLRVDLADATGDGAADHGYDANLDAHNEVDLGPAGSSEDDVYLDHRYAGFNGATFDPSDDTLNNIDPCRMFHCGRGEVCELDVGGNPLCLCQDISTCPTNVPDLQNVCSTNNETYENHCQFYASKCALESTTAHRIHLDYVGPCKHMAPCLDTQLDEFPLRLRDWLKTILVQMYEQDRQSPGILSPAERATMKRLYNEQHLLPPGAHSPQMLLDDFTHNYHHFTYPVHWQFHQLDRHPVDGYLTHSELAPLREPGIPLEHCATRFFTACDTSGDAHVSLREWAKCFGLREEDIDANYIF
ncbi:uncharacterized protein LOC144601010 [Rhinoraja longicauda]